jgi:DNA-binding NtrC family response regulator
MSAEPSELIQAVSHQRAQAARNQGTAHGLQIAESPLRSRVGRLVDLTNSLLQEIEILARDQTFVDDGSRLQMMLQGGGIDLFQEVRRFEINLINMALKQTHGHQARAAKLLNINPTTLNSKIKLYGIEY